MKREEWTKKLARIIADIEAGKTPAPVRELYVFGSYSRGALECKDLDIVIVHEEAPVELMEKLKKRSKETARTFLEGLIGHETRFRGLMSKVLRRPGEEVDIFLGRDLPSILSGRAIQQSDLRLVWSSTDRAWQEKLRAIPLDLHAGPAPRDHFISPKLAQSSEEHVNRVTTLLRQQVLILTRIATESLNVQEISDEWADIFNRHRWGRKLQTLIPYAFAWLASQKVNSVNVREERELWDTDQQFRVQLGPLHLYWMVHLFQDQPRLRKQCLIPHFRRAYAKEILIFERGPAWESRTDPWHPLKSEAHNEKMESEE